MLSLYPIWQNQKKQRVEFQKSFCTDFLTKKMKKNEGELSQYHVNNSHSAIVSVEVFELAQMEM